MVHFALSTPSDPAIEMVHFALSGSSVPLLALASAASSEPAAA